MREKSYTPYFIAIIVLLWLLLMKISISDSAKDTFQSEKPVQQEEVGK